LRAHFLRDMLNRIKKDETERLQQTLMLKPDVNVRVSALLKAYGTGLNFFNVWHQDFDTVLARLEGSFFICAGENADYEEIAFFLKFNPYFRRLTGEAGAVNKITEYLSSDIGRCRYDFLSYDKPEAEDVQAEIEISPKLEDVYSVMEKARSSDFTVGDFPPWYTDV